MRHLLMICACGAIALPAAAQDALFRCVDGDGVVMLADRPCDTVPDAARAPEPKDSKEHFALPPAEQGRSRWVGKAPASVPPKVDVETLRLARQALGLRDKVASSR